VFSACFRWRLLPSLSRRPPSRLLLPCSSSRGPLRPSPPPPPFPPSSCATLPRTAMTTPKRRSEEECCARDAPSDAFQHAPEGLERGAVHRRRLQHQQRQPHPDRGRDDFTIGAQARSAFTRRIHEVPRIPLCEVHTQCEEASRGPCPSHGKYTKYVESHFAKCSPNAKRRLEDLVPRVFMGPVSQPVRSPLSSFFLERPMVSQATGWEERLS